MIYARQKWLAQGVKIWRERRGSITMIAAVMFPVLIGVSGLGVEYGDGLLTRVENQRTADLAAYSAALVYSSTSSTTSMQNAASSLATLNGLAGSSTVASLVNSPTGDGNKAVQVTVTTTVPLVLSQLFGTGSTLPVSAQAYVELPAGNPACIIALQASGNGVILSGGTSVTAASCSVASNSDSASSAGVQVPCGDTITTKTVYYASTPAPSQPCSGIKTSSGGSASLIKAATADPLVSNSEVTAATSHLTTVKSMTSPTVTAPTVPSGTSVSFPYCNKGCATLTMPAGCTAVNVNSQWTVTCIGAGPFDFGTVVVPTGMSPAIFINATAATFNFASITGPVDFTSIVSNTYNISGGIWANGTSTYGAGTYNIGGGITTAGGSTTTFGAGTYNLAHGSTSCGDYSICHTGSTLRVGGPSTFVMANGIYNSGGETITLGAGTTNSYKIGGGSTGNGNAIYAGGGSTTTFADATGASSVFQLTGIVNVSSGGGSCMTLPAAAAHDINGNFSTAGGTTLGAGVYTVNGYVALGANGGGDVSCGGSTVGMYGSGVSFVISGSSTLSSGSCSGTAFCVAAGYGHVTLTAPTTGAMANLVVVGPTSSGVTTGASFAEGATNTTLAGAFYLPYGAISLSGGASVGSGTGQCLELIGSQVTLAGGSTLASSCSGLQGGVTGGKIMLVD